MTTNIHVSMTFPHQLTRDEHLLLGVLIMIVLDLAIMLPWTLVDPITCQRKNLTTVFEVNIVSEYVYLRQSVL